LFDSGLWDSKDNKSLEEKINLVKNHQDLSEDNK